MNLAGLASADDSAADPGFVPARALQVDRWPDAWHALAPQTRRWTLDAATVQALGRQSAGYADWFSPCSAEPLRALARQLDDAVQHLGGRAFVRLNSRSPKDALWALRHGLCVHNGAQALALFLSGSRRCAADLRQALTRRSEVQMVVRAWIDIPPGHEFRCFMQNRVWVGTSPARPAPGAEEAGPSLAEHQLMAILQTLMLQLLATAPVSDAAFDVALLATACRDALRPVLLDANPLIAGTDRAAYTLPDGTDLPFDGGMRHWVAQRST